MRRPWIASCSSAVLVQQPERVVSPVRQKIFRIRREYNSWVANETMEDYALRYTPSSFRK